jgi:hypothetical protein
MCALLIGCGEVTARDAEPSGGSSAGGAGAAGQASNGGKPQGGQSSGGKAMTTPAAGEATVAEAGAGGSPDVPENSAAGAAGEVTSGAGGKGGGGAFVYPDDEELLGAYDVTFDQPPLIDGCTALVSIPRLNLHIYRDASNEVWAAPYLDFGWSYNAETSWMYDDGWLTINATHDSSLNELTPALHFLVDENGFTGIGQSMLPYSCNGEVVLHWLDVTIGPDVTSPRIRLDPGYAGREAFPFNFFFFSFSEPLRRVSGTAGHDFAFRTEQDIEESVALWDVESDAELGTTAKGWLFGPALGLMFDDVDAARGHQIQLEVTEPWVDFAGNIAVAVDETFPVRETGPALSELDFDDGPHPGVRGNHSYYAPGAAGSPCEAGGCLALTGTLSACDGPRPSVLALRLADANASKFRVHYRIWSSSSATPALLVYEAPGCEAPFSAALSPLAEPAGTLDHATAWLTDDFSCLGPSPDKGIVLSFGCIEGYDLADGPVDVRLVVESVTPVQ